MNTQPPPPPATPLSTTSVRFTPRIVRSFCFVFGSTIVHCRYPSFVVGVIVIVSRFLCRYTAGRRTWIQRVALDSGTEQQTPVGQRSAGPGIVRTAGRRLPTGQLQHGKWKLSLNVVVGNGPTNGDFWFLRLPCVYINKFTRTPIIVDDYNENTRFEKIKISFRFLNDFERFNAVSFFDV